MLNALGIRKGFDGRAVLDGVDLKVQSGDVFCLLGANGAGKSTLLKLCLGLMAPDAGELRINSHAPGSSQALDSITYLPEWVALYPELTGLENLDLLANANRSAQPKDLETLEDALTSVGLAPEAQKRRVASYSKGMRQRVGIALAVVRRSPILLLDEPITGLDPQAADDLDQLISQRAEEGCAVLMATHDIYRAAQVGTRFGYLHQGHLSNPIDGKITAAELDAYCRSGMQS
ncbi:MAG: ABC transporter ATP-binding protein [Myxococcota bacterium]